MGTASNVMNGKDVVSAGRRELVLQAAKEIGYRPNGLARGLRQQRTNVVGLSISSVTSAFHSSLAEAIEGIAASSQQTLMQVMTHGDCELEYARIDALIQRRVDGIIMLPSQAPQRSFKLLKDSRTPAVMLGWRVDPEYQFDCITLNERAAMAAAVGHLAELGHRRILFLVRFPQLSVTRERIEALNAFAAESGGVIRPTVMAFGDNRALFEQEFPNAMSNPDAPTAIIASNSILALWMARLLLQRDMIWPRDVSIVSFDEPIWGDIVKPQLTIVRQPIAEFARDAWDLLWDRITGTSNGAARHVMREAQLVLRGSTAPIWRSAGCFGKDRQDTP